MLKVLSNPHIKILRCYDVSGNTSLSLPEQLLILFRDGSLEGT